VLGVDLHAIEIALAHGQDPDTAPRSAPTAGAAASFVYRAFDPADRVKLPNTALRQAFAHAFPDGLLFQYPKSRGSIQRDFKWLGSYRYGITHLGGRDADDLRQRCEAASALLGWPAPYADLAIAPAAHGAEVPGHGTALPAAPISSTSPMSQPLEVTS